MTGKKKSLVEMDIFPEDLYKPIGKPLGSLIWIKEQWNQMRYS